MDPDAELQRLYPVRQNWHSNQQSAHSCTFLTFLNCFPRAATDADVKQALEDALEGKNVLKPEDFFVGEQVC